MSLCSWLRRSERHAHQSVVCAVGVPLVPPVAVFGSRPSSFAAYARTTRCDTDCCCEALAFALSNGSRRAIFLLLASRHTQLFIGHTRLRHAEMQDLHLR